MKANPYTIRDFSRGRVAPGAVANQLAPENSVSDSLNVNFDTRIGAGVVRLGTTKLGATVASNKNPLGISKLTTANLTTNTVVAAFSGASTASIYYYDSSWHTSGLTALSNTAKIRFSMLGGRIFMVNGTDAMKSSTNGNTWATTDCMTTRTPSLIIRQKNRLLTSGDSTYPSRVWFSSIIDPTASPFITWSENATSGDFIDVNPDDGDYGTAFAETSTLTLFFKSNAMYRLNVISKTVDTENIFNIGAVSQEAVVRCQGVVYFFSGQDIRRTTGDFPQQISRIGVQDFIDAIPQANWSSVTAGTDGFNVFFSIGNVTLNTNKNTQVTYSNVVLKFSPRDESWSVHSYGNHLGPFTQYITSSGQTLLEADYSGNVQTINSGLTDNGTAINYFLNTQDIEFTGRQNTKKLADKLVSFTNNGQDSTLSCATDDQDLKPVIRNNVNRVNIGKDLNLEGRWFVFSWFGQSSGTSPSFEGIHIPDVTDQGIT